MADDLLTLTIREVGAQGDGIADGPDGLVYIPYAAAGDVLKARITERQKSGSFAEIVEMITPSPARMAPPCQHFTKCGGCQLQFMSGEDYRTWVKNRVASAMGHHGFDPSAVRDPVITPPASRRRVALKARRTVQGVVLGFNERQSHTIVDLKACPITRAELTTLFEPLRHLLASLLPQGMHAVLHLTLTASGVDLVIEAAKELSLADREALVSFADTYDLAAVHWQDGGFLDPVAIRREPVMQLGSARVALPPAAFIQASDEGEAALVAAVKEGVGDARRVADLFCGIGTFSFPLAESAQVLAVEGAKGALDALAAAATQATGLKQIVTRHRDLYRRPISGPELKGFDAVMFDPPRAGAKEQASALAASDIPVIVGVSCNPNTFARDARLLVDGGYSLTSVLPVDQFLWSSHVEIVATFRKG